MSRPSRSEEKRLEALEGIAALLSQVLEATGILAVRLRQVQRRAPELARVINPASEELRLIVDSCDDARRLLGEVLEMEQARRREQNERKER